MYKNRNLDFLRMIVEGGEGGGGITDPAPVVSAEPSSPAAPVVNTGYTAEDLAKARTQEKDKLYPEIERLKADLAAKEARISAWEQSQKDAADAANRKAEAEMDFHTLLAKKEEEFNLRLQEEAAQREQAFTLLEREREFQALQSHLQTRLAEEENSIIPQLRDLVTGTSVDEIEASIAAMKERSALIISDTQAAMQSARQGMQGSRITSPASGPLDTDPEHRSLTDADVRSMSMADYIKNRSRLLGGASSNSGRGIFGG